MENTEEEEPSLETLKQYYAFRRSFWDITKCQRDEVVDIIKGLISSRFLMHRESIQYSRLHFWLALYYDQKGDLKKANYYYSMALYTLKTVGLDLSLRRWVKVEEKGDDCDTKFVDGEELMILFIHIFNRMK